MAKAVQSDLENCCAQIFYEMETLGLQPGREDWVRHPESQNELESMIRDVWIAKCGGVATEWPWNQAFVLLTFIRERKKPRNKKDKTKTMIMNGTLFPQPEGKIYFLENTRRHIKIGWTGGDVYKRIAALQTGESEPLRLIGWMFGTEDQEKVLHVRFAAYRTYGGGEEWFHPNEQLKQFIADHNHDESNQSANLRPIRDLQR